MKKLLFLLLGVIIVFVFVQSFGLTNYLFTNPKSSPERQVTNSPTIDISQAVKPPPIIGIHYRMIDKQTAAQNNLVEGAYITQVIKGSPAEKAKILEEDIIIEIDGKKIEGVNEKNLYNLVSVVKPGAQINLKIWRNKQIINIFITL